MDSILAEAARLESQSIPYVMATVVRTVRPTSATVGARAVVKENHEVSGYVGGECTRNIMLEVADLAFADGRPRLLILSPDPEDPIAMDGQVIVKAMTCHSGGTVELFIEPHLGDPRLIVVGNSPIARAVMAAAQTLPFSQTQVVLNEEQPDLELLINDLRQAALPGSYVVVATMGQYDESAIDVLKEIPLSYLGIVASPRRGQILKERWAESENNVTLEAPAGLNLGGQHPGEIAISILAQMIALRRERHESKEPAASPRQRHGLYVEDPVCHMAVNLETTLYKGEWNGKDWGFCCLSCQESFFADPEQFVSNLNERKETL